jgi:hypothetical protein
MAFFLTHGPSLSISIDEFTIEFVWDPHEFTNLIVDILNL